MSRGWGGRILCLLACLVAGCGGPAPGTPPPRPLPPAPSAAPAGRWVVVTTPRLVLAFDRARAIALVRPVGAAATAATAREGPDPGAASGGLLLREELRAAGETIAGAPGPGTPGPTVTPVLAGDEARLVVEDMRLGDVGTARWEIALRGDEVTLVRAVTLRRAAAAAEAGLAMAPPEAGTGARLLLLDGVALRASPDLAARRERLRGATVGAVDLDREGFLFSARSDEATSAATAVRDGRAWLTLGNALAAASGSGIRARATLRLGAATHLQGPQADFAPALDARFLAAGYYGNVLRERHRQRLPAAARCCARA